jgi:hypothetical protein
MQPERGFVPAQMKGTIYADRLGADLLGGDHA